MSADASRKSYYQRAFLSILEAVIEVYASILHEEELKLYKYFVDELDCGPQRLLIRMFLRKPGWLRLSKLEYDDIEAIPDCANILVEQKLVEKNSDSLADYISLLTIPELKLLAKRLGRSVSNNANRDTLIEAILVPPAKTQRKICFSATGSLTSSASQSASEDALNQARRLTGPIIQLVPQVLKNLHLAISLYFLVSSETGAVQESLSTAILNEINRRKYPKYEIIRSGPIFSDRAEFESYQIALQQESALDEEPIGESGIKAFEEAFDAAVETSKASRKSYFLKRYSAGWIYCRILGTIAAALEAAKEHARAIEIYQLLLKQTEFSLGRRGRWWERCVLDLARHLKDPQAALKLCQEALNDPLVRTSARISLQRRLKRLSQASEDLDLLEEEEPEIVSISGRIKAGNVTGRKVKLHLHDDDLALGSVEDFVLSEFEKCGWQGIHCESSFFTTLFGLMFWDILFGPTADVFQTAYQNAPLDLQTDAFYISRQSSLEARLELIQNDLDASIAIMKRHHLEHHQTSCVGIDWETFGGEEGITLLSEVCRKIGSMALSTILRQFAEDYRNHRSGLPDLLLWRNDEMPPGEEEVLISNANGVVFAEVKSPNDRMSDAQRYWFSVLKSAGMRVVLVQVTNKEA